jgi:hypothetical protein
MRNVEKALSLAAAAEAFNVPLPGFRDRCATSQADFAIRADAPGRSVENHPGAATGRVLRTGAQVSAGRGMLKN